MVCSARGTTAGVRVALACGVAATAAIRDRFEIPVVFLTAYSNPEVLECAKVAEPFEYVLKRCEERELQVVTETALYKHRAERKICENERRYRTMLESVGDGIIAVDPSERITWLDPVAERITDWRQAAAEGQTIESVFPLLDLTQRTPVSSPVQATLRDEIVDRLDGDCLFATRDGRELRVGIRLRPSRSTASGTSRERRWRSET